MKGISKFIDEEQCKVLEIHVDTNKSDSTIDKQSPL